MPIRTNDTNEQRTPSWRMWKWRMLYLAVLVKSPRDFPSTDRWSNEEQLLRHDDFSDTKSDSIKIPTYSASPLIIKWRIAHTRSLIFWMRCQNLKSKAFNWLNKTFVVLRTIHTISSVNLHKKFKHSRESSSEFLSKFQIALLLSQIVYCNSRYKHWNTLYLNKNTHWR